MSKWKTRDVWCKNEMRRDKGHETDHMKGQQWTWSRFQQYIFRKLSQKANSVKTDISSKSISVLCTTVERMDFGLWVALHEPNLRRRISKISKDIHGYKAPTDFDTAVKPSFFSFHLSSKHLSLLVHQNFQYLTLWNTVLLASSTISLLVLHMT